MLQLNFKLIAAIILRSDNFLCYFHLYKLGYGAVMQGPDLLNILTFITSLS